MACLDTTFLIDLSRRRGARQEHARSKLRELVGRGEQLSASRFTAAELYVGVYRARERNRERETVDAVLSGLEILEFDEAAAKVFGRLTAHLQEIGRPAGDMDVLIAATAISANEPLLITRNPAHYADLPGVRVESY